MTNEESKYTVHLTLRPDYLLFNLQKGLKHTRVSMYLRPTTIDNFNRAQCGFQ